MTAADPPGPKEGTRLLGSGFDGDDGTADPAVRAALAAARAGDASDALAVAALQASRLLVPVVAVLGETGTGPDGLVHDKSSDMAAVLLTGADGRRALLAFTGTDSLAAWDAAARPVPVDAATAARAAVQEGAAALLVDVAGPASLVVAGDDLAALAAGWRLVRIGDDLAWVVPGDPAPGDRAASGDSAGPE